MAAHFKLDGKEREGERPLSGDLIEPAARCQAVVALCPSTLSKVVQTLAGPERAAACKHEASEKNNQEPSAK